MKDVDPWNSPAVQNDLGTLGIPYTEQSFIDVNWSALGAYRAVLLEGSAGNDLAYLNAIPPNMSWLEDYVRGGGLLLIHYAPWPGDLGSAYSGVIGPAGLKFNMGFTEAVNIRPGFATDPLLQGVPEASLQNWNYTAHGYFSEVPAGTQALLGWGIGADPVYLRYQLGAGQVWATSMLLEYSAANPDLLRNELALAFIPEPSTCALAGLGAAVLMKLRRRRAASCNS